MSDLLAVYAREIQRSGYGEDPAQMHALTRLEHLFRATSAPKTSPVGRLLRRLRGDAEDQIPAGFYLVGGVGRGKTFVIDLAFEALPLADKWRIHFHSFMQYVHEALRKVGDVQNPLNVVGEQIARRCSILALDEFHVTDITDAMILAGLLEVLDAHGVRILTSSNDHPDELYAGGLQRERFLPAIDHIKRRFELINFDGEVDYRLRQLTRAPVYLVPDDDESRAELGRTFDALTRGLGREGGVIEVDGRSLPVVRSGEHTAWFTFDTLCVGARSARDYIELARRFETVLLTGVPSFRGDTDDAARRFMTMVDEFYDRRVKLIMTAAAEPDALYQGQRLAAGFRRTASRLTEMRSEAFLHRPHLA